MNRNQYFSETVNSSITIERNEEADFSTNKSNKLIISISCLIFATATASNIRAFEDESELSFHEYQKKTVMIESSTTVVSSQNFSSYNQKGDTLEMNNDKLEVDDLADKVTQSQLDEIKAHFDTKMTGLKMEVMSELKEYIGLETTKIIEKMNEIEKEKEKKKASFVANYKAPLITGLVIAVAPYILNLFPLITKLFK